MTTKGWWQPQLLGLLFLLKISVEKYENTTLHENELDILYFVSILVIDTV